MKKLLLLALVVLSGLAGCSSQKKLEKTTPFVVGEAVLIPWIGGREESGSGYTVKITLSQMSSRRVELQNIYFRGRRAEVVMDMDDMGMMATARFEESRPDTVMQGDPQQETAGQPPKTRDMDPEVFPFVLKSNEAVLSYFENDKVKYAKISGIREQPARIYPGKPQD